MPALHKFPSLIEAIFLSKDGGDTIRCLLGNDAQTFIDVIDEACPIFFTIADLLIRIEIGAFCWLATRYARSFAIGTKQGSQIVVQGLWPPQTSSESFEDPHLL